jgi:short-chain fatty acids transporter
LPQSILQISGVIPLSQTLGLWQGMLIAAVLIVVSMAISFYSHPEPAQARDMKDMGVGYEPAAPHLVKLEKPGEWLENSALLTVVISAFGIVYLIREVSDKGASIILDLNHYIFMFLIAGFAPSLAPAFFRECSNCRGAVLSRECSFNIRFMAEY